MRRYSSSIFVTAALLCLLITSASCRREERSPSLYQQSRFLMGTLVEITVVIDDEERGHQFVDEAFDEMKRLEALVGKEYREGEIFSLNNQGYPSGQVVSGEVFELLHRSGEKSREMEGFFDFTLGRLADLWDINRRQIPSASDIAVAREAAGWEKVGFERETRKVTFKEPGFTIDLGGIAKGYAVDRACSLLKERGIIAGIVNGGGDLRLWGRKPGGSLWVVGIQHPRDKGGLLGRLELSDRAVATSGDYERNFFVANELYHHIIDPRSGQPARGIQSVTVITDTAEEADAYATGIFVMGRERGLRFMKGKGNLQGIIVDDRGDVHFSEGVEDVFRED